MMLEDDEAGFSTIESLAAITIIMVSIVILVSIATLSTKKLTNTGRQIATNAAVLTADSLIRRSVQRIRPPIWQKEIPLITTYNSIEIPWLDGDRNQKLKIEYTEHYLTITTDHGEKTIINQNGCKDLTFMQVSPYVTKKGIIQGIDIQFSASNKLYTTRATFSSTSLCGYENDKS